MGFFPQYRRYPGNSRVHALSKVTERVLGLVLHKAAFGKHLSRPTARSIIREQTIPLPIFEAFQHKNKKQKTTKRCNPG